MRSVFGLLCAGAVTLALLPAPSAAKPANPLLKAPDEEVKPYQLLTIDINNDGKPESVGLVPYNYSTDGYLGQLVFFDENGEPIWKGPRAKYLTGQAFMKQDPRFIMDNPLIFGKAGDLSYDLKFVIDPDHDGKIIVAAGEVPVGVQISTFRVMRWTGSEFVCLKKDCRLIEDPMNPDHYVWSDRPLHSYNSGYSDGRWVRDLRRTDRPNQLRAIIREVKHPFSGPDREPRFRRGEALLEPEETGLKMIRWEHPLEKWFKID